MPDYGFIANPQTPDSFKTIGSLLNFAGQSQNLQRGGIALQKERETLEPEIARVKAESQTAQTGAMASQWKLDAEQANAGRQLLGGLLTNAAVISGDSKGSMDALMQVEDQARSLKIPEDKIRANLAPFYAAAVHRPQNLAGMVKQVIVGGISPSGQGAAVAPSGPMVTNQAQTGMMNTNPLAPNTGGQPGMVPGTVFNNQLPLGERQSVSINPVTNSPMVTSRDAFGNVTGVTPAPQPAGAVPNLLPGDSASIPVLEGERNQARNILASAPIAHTTNRGILEELPKTTTGTVGPTLAKLASTLGVQFDTAEHRASAYDLIGKYTERNALEAAKAMGPGTNAGLEAAIKANGSAAYNPTALKTITELNDAIVSGAELYQPGLEKAIQANGQRGVLAKREFDQAWAQNFDTRIMQINAGTINAKMLSAPVRAELLKKAQNLERLSTQGRL